LLRHLAASEKHALVLDGKGIELDLLFDGNVPPGGGVSSSSAMVTCTGLAVLEAFVKGDRRGISRKEITEVVIESERLVGVNSGGMDQTASVFSVPSHLLHVEFIPTLKATPVPLPKTTPALSFVIANTLVTSDKHTTAKIHYNLRVVECRIGALMLAKYLSLSLPIQPLPTLKNITDAYFAQHPSAGTDVEINIDRLNKILELALEKFEDRALTWSEVYDFLGMEESLFKTQVVGGFEVEADKLWIRKRVKHVFSEALRVYQFRQLLDSQEGAGKDVLLQMGALMNQSQSSCRDYYDCSCPEIDEMVSIGKKNGALGSRLTGAGWGGCTVHLIPEPSEKEFINKLKEEYYAKRFPNLTEEELSYAVFATKPESGACIFLVGEETKEVIVED